MINKLVRLPIKLIIRSLVAVMYHYRYVFGQFYGRRVLKDVANKGSNCRFVGRVQIHDPDHLELGDNIRIGQDSFFYCKGGLTIGSNTQISRFVTIYTANHDIAGDAIPYDDTYVTKPVQIGKSVWIGMNVCITPGVTIGDGAIIGMGTVVSKDVPAGAIVVGAASRAVDERDMARFAQLDDAGRHFSKLWPEK